MSFSNWNRKLHRWGSIITLLPVGVILVTGVVLQLKKKLDWVQPPTVKGRSKELAIEFEEILSIAQAVPEAAISSWADIDRLDVRPAKGMLKVRAKNRWEIQIDTSSGKILQVALRRSDLIERLHDGSFFSSYAKLWVFLPSALILLFLWLTGFYLFFLPNTLKWKKRQRVPAANHGISGNP
jgi:uncharacterized iron-regulated membrane protein